MEKTKQLKKWTISCNKRDNKALKKTNIKSPIMIWLNMGVSIWGKITWILPIYPKVLFFLSLYALTNTSMAFEREDYTV